MRRFFWLVRAVPYKVCGLARRRMKMQDSSCRGLIYQAQPVAIHVSGLMNQTPSRDFFFVPSCLRVLVAIFIAAVFIFSSCSGHKPVTEPVKPVEITIPAEEEAPLEPSPEAESQEERLPPLSAADGRKPQPPTQEEVIPVIEPEQNPTGPEPPGTAALNTLMTDITSGITAIFREFGYLGDIDVPENFKKRVAYYIRYFSNDEDGSQFYSRGISRGHLYLPMIKKILKEKHLPPTLAYLPLIESGFNPTAYSRAGALGMWQFMKGTARMYGLTVTSAQDERKDPVKSTYAAAEYLNDLLAMFGLEDPFLGICAFNAGEGKILSALRKISYTERSFWTLVKKNLLQNETNEYIPQFLAVILMVNNPEKYSLVPPTALAKKEKASGNTQEDQEIISSLHHSDSRDDLEDEPEEGSVLKDTEVSPPPGINTTDTNGIPRFHKVKPGDTLYSIAKRYEIDLKQLKSWNRLRSNRINVGQELKIHPPDSSTAASRQKTVGSPEKTSSKGYKLIYTVNPSDSLARIALLFKGVSARDIMKWNRLARSRIYPKQKLILYIDAPPRKVVNHTVKKGENAFKIARRYKVRVEFVLSLNGLIKNSPLKPGQKLKIYYF